MHILPKISIITVCFNAAKDIERTMLSVLNQHYDNVEYIVIDGGSKDGTQAIVEKYKDRLAYFVSEPDHGIYDAMNKGLKHATGAWVNFMNAGDLFADEEVLNDVFGKKSIPAEVRVIGGNTINVYADREEIHHAEQPDAIWDRMPFSHQAAFVRIDTYRWQFLTRYRIAADYALLYDTLDTYGESAFKVVDRSIARYMQEDSFTFANLHKAKGEYLDIQSRHKNWRWWKEWMKWKMKK